jgi:hypothetical protein
LLEVSFLILINIYKQHHSAGSLYEHRLKSMRQEHLLYISRWSTPLVNQTKYESQVSSAREIAEEIFTGTTAARPLHWLPPLVPNPSPLENRYPHCLVQFDPDILYDIEANSGCEVHQTSVNEHPGEHPDASTVCEDDISDVNEDVLEALNLEDPLKDTEEDKQIVSVITVWEIHVSCKTMSKYPVV